MSLLLAFVLFVLLVIVFSALTITTSGIRAQPLRSWGGRSREEVVVWRVQRLKKNVHRGAIAGKQTKEERWRCTAKIQARWLLKFTFFCEGAPEGSERSPLRLKGAPASSSPYARFLVWWQRTPFDFKERWLTLVALPSFYQRQIRISQIHTLFSHFSKLLKVFYIITFIKGLL